jgi:signal transduction histidine kinase
LEGFDDRWTDAGTRRQAFYTNLPPRDYRFQLSATNSDGIWNDAGSVLNFSIEPAFYQTGWFYAGCATVAILSVLASWRWKLRQTRRRFAAVLAERVRISREIHDTLLQSLVGVAVQLTGLTSGLGSAFGKEREQLQRMRRQVEHYIREARQSIWDLRSPVLHNADLSSALREAGEHAVQDRAVRFEAVVRGNVRRYPAKTEEQVLRIGLEAINNAVRHARARKVIAELCYEPDALRLRVADDGCGFSPAERALRPGDHCGLLVMQERAEQIGGRFTLDAHEGRGTTIEVVVPNAFGHRVPNHVEVSHPRPLRG